MWLTTSGGRRTRFARAACRSRWPSAWLSACSAAALLAAGCGAEERDAIPRPTAEALAAQADRVAVALEGGDLCGADRLADELVTEAEAAQVPADYRKPLVAAARSLADSVACPPPPPVEQDEDKDEEEDKDKDEDDGDGNGNGKGKGNGKGNGKKDKD